MTRDEWAAKLTAPLDPVRTLMAAYFNQDWEVEFSPAWQDVATAFVKGEPVDLVKSAMDELDQLVNSDLNETDLRSLLKRLASGILPENLGVSNRQWLRELRTELDSQLHDRSH